jgi:GNAT superfamily N-acetyltransferase
MPDKCAVDNVKVRQRKAFIEVGAVNKDNKIVGAASLSNLRTDKKFLWLHEIQVHPECRRKGVGSAIMDKITEVGKKAEAELIYAYPAVPMNAKGKELSPKQLLSVYRKQGFKPCNAPKDVSTVTDEGLFKRGVCKSLKE